jgi:hypothetical protein
MSAEERSASPHERNEMRKSLRAAYGVIFLSEDREQTFGVAWLLFLNGR